MNVSSGQSKTLELWNWTSVFRNEGGKDPRAQAILRVHREPQLPHIDRQDSHSAGLLGAEDETAAVDMNAKEEVYAVLILLQISPIVTVLKRKYEEGMTSLWGMVV